MQSSNYYQPNQQQYMMQPPIVDESSAADGGVEEEDSDGSGRPDKRSGRRKIKIEYIGDKSRRHITFSKRKAGIMKKAYELSTLTGTQVLLLVVSETGLVYTFTTPKLQPLVTKPEGKNLIQSCLNAPDPQESSSSMDHPLPSQPPNSRSIMSTNAPKSPPTTSNYYRSNQNVDNSNNYIEDRKTFGSMVASNPTMILNNNDPQQQMTSNYTMPYAPYNTSNQTNATSSGNTPLYSYNLPPQQDNSERYWNSNVNSTVNTKRQDKR
ncbi:hypothetical protein MFLAVUS_001188 [Mucor flavus]|uniref:MADS-box domain-containing protein n=1 Tax=Mucor flavus TaxID=439312 RepID=A0ABP9YLS7_9FUNG